MSEIDEITKLPELINVIKADVGRLLGGDVTVAIVNSAADIKYIDAEIQDFTDFIISFTKGNFELLSIGDHSLPLSGTNIAFFKVSAKSLVILNSSKGPVGQLLAFKGRMGKYSAKIDELLESAPAAAEEKVPAKAAARVPVLTVSISNKKFAMEEAKVLHLVNGQNTITDICARTKLPQLKVDEILRKYQKKKWIKLKRLIIGVAATPAAKPAKKPVPKPPVSPVQRIPVGERADSVYIFPILEGAFQAKKFPKKDARILKLCDGQSTIEDIIQETSLNRLNVMEVIKKYEKKKKLKLTKIVPSRAKVEGPQIEEPSIIPAVPAPASPAIPSLPIEPVQEEVVFDELMDILDQTQPIEMQQAQPAPPVYQPAPSAPAPATPMPPRPPAPYPPAPVAPQPVAPPAPAIPKTPSVPQAPQNLEISKVQPEPVGEGLFDDLTSLLDQTAPMEQPAPAAPAPAIPQDQPQIPQAPIAPAPPEAISGNSLLEESEGIKITTYPDEDPLQNRLDRLSNILEETTEEAAPKEGTPDVQIIGSKAVCPSCKTHVIMMAKVCPNCNRPLRICPNCKSPITLFARICPSCGSLL